MNYKLLALDIDGTLLDSQSRLTERVILAVPLFGRTTWKHCTPSRCRRRISDPILRVLREADIALCATRNSAVPPDVFCQMTQAASEWLQRSSYIDSQGENIRLVR